MMYSQNLLPPPTFAGTCAVVQFSAMAGTPLSKRALAEIIDNKGCRCQFHDGSSKYAPTDKMTNSVKGGPGYTIKDIGTQLDCCARCQVPPPAESWVLSAESGPMVLAKLTV